MAQKNPDAHYDVRCLIETSFLSLMQAAPEPTSAAPLGEVGVSQWPSLGDAKQPLKKKERPDGAASVRLC